MVKIKISYESPGELLQVTRLLQPIIKDVKQIKRSDKGVYKNAYITIRHCGK